MSRQVQIQTNFSVGELDPLLRGRQDLKQYYNALQTANNVFIQPQGGIKRRDGLKYIAELPAAANPQDGVKLVPFEYSSDDSYMFAIVNQRIYIFKNNALITNINGSGVDYFAVSALTSSVLSALNYAQYGDTILFMHNDLQPVRIVRGANDATWVAAFLTFDNQPVHPFTFSVSNPAAAITASQTTGNITITATAGVFASGNVGQYINITSNYGRARIVEYVSTTQVKGHVTINFFDTAQVLANGWELEAGYEDAWSASKGWPTSCTFHESRLYIGGSKSLPTHIWASRVGDYFNFELGEGLDDEALSAELTTDSLNAIQQIFSGRDLQIFTTGGEFYIPQSVSDPITPGNFMVKIATRNGIKPGVPVAGLDSGTIFIQRSGKSLNELIYTDSELAYTTSNISVMSSHLLNDPVDISIRRATSTEESDRLFIVNAGDGSLSVYSILRSQNVVAPSKFTTDGTFKAIGVDVDDTYVIVNRTLPFQATCTITVSDYANIAGGSTITLQKNDGTTVVFTSTTSSPSTNEFRTQTNNNTTATNLQTTINAHSDFSATVISAVVTVTRLARGNDNLTNVASDNTRLTTINFTGGVTNQFFVEVFDSSLHTDASVYISAASSTGTAAHLPNTLVDILNDGNVEAQQTLNGSGVATFTRSSASNYEMGLPFSITIKTMPVEPQLKSGGVKGFKKRILQVNAEVHQTKSMSVNNQLVPFRQFGENVLDIPVNAFTGLKQIGPLLGFDYEGSITISQSVPLSINILSLDYKVSLGQ